MIDLVSTKSHSGTVCLYYYIKVCIFVINTKILCVNRDRKLKLDTKYILLKAQLVNVN